MKCDPGLTVNLWVHKSVCGYGGHPCDKKSNRCCVACQRCLAKQLPIFMCGRWGIRKMSPTCAVTNGGCNVKLMSPETKRPVLHKVHPNKLILHACS